MADEEIEIDVNVNVDDAAAGFQRLQTQIRDTTRQLQAAADAGDKVKFKQLRSNLDDLEDKLEVTTLKSKQFDDQLAGLPGPLGQAGSAVKTFDGGLKLLSANPILAIVTALVGVFLLFKKSLESTAEGQATLTRITEGFNKILGPILATIEAVALPLFKSLAFVIEKVGGAFSFFAKALGTSDKKIKEASSGVKDFIEENKKLAAEQKKAAAELEAKEKKQYDAAKAAITNAEDVKESEDKLAQAQLRNSDDKIKQIQQEQEFADANYQREVKRIEDLMKVINLTEDDRRKLVIERNNLEAQGITDKQNRDKSIKLIEDEIAKKKEEDDKKLLEGQLANLDMLNNARAVTALADYNSKVANNTATYQDQIVLFHKLRAADLENLKNKVADRKATQAEVEAFNKETEAQELQILKLQQAEKLDVISGALGAVAQLVGENTVAGKAISVAQAIIDTYSGANKALSAFPPPFNFIAAGTVIAAGLLNVKKIISTKIPKVPGSSVSDSASSSVPTPAFSQPTIGSPQIGPTASQQGQLSGIVAGAISSNQSVDRPIRAYVIGNEITTQQQLDRRIRSAARLGG